MEDLQEFHETLFNDISSSASAGNDFLQRAFFEAFCQYLDAAGEIEMPEYAYYKDQQGRAINGYYLNDSESGDGSLNLFVSIYSGTNEVSTINKDEIKTAFKRIEKFFTKSLDSKFHQNMEESSDGYNASQFIFSHQNVLTNLNLYLLTDKKLSARLEAIPQEQLGNVKINYHLWDLTRLHRLVSSERVPEDIIIDFNTDFGDALPCLPANLDETEYKAYLVVIPGIVLTRLYEKYGARLLERNVRSFLQARGKVNKGIRETILRKPEMFFAYNNGITATAESIDLGSDGEIKSLTNLQIVNGGQTTASLFSAYKKDKADIRKVFVQMKLSVVTQELGDEMVPMISKYANSQNKVNDADFFATHQFHKRMEDFSRRVYAPPVDGQLNQTKWFYERARGQYLNGYSYATPSEKKKFQLDYPKKQFFTKTDLAKFEGVWMQLPHIVSKGAQYIFLDYADKIDEKWKRDDTQFNDAYYKITIAKAITFKAAEKVVSAASWYDGSFRANIVAYTLAYIAYRTEKIGKSVDFMKIWNKQAVTYVFEDVLRQLAKEVFYKLMNNGIVSNITQFCKRPVCWDTIKRIDLKFSEEFFEELVDESALGQEMRAAKSGQKIENDIQVETHILEIGEDNWRRLREFGKSKNTITPKEDGILASLFKNKYVSASQGRVLLILLEKMQSEGFDLTR